MAEQKSNSPQEDASATREGIDSSPKRIYRSVRDRYIAGVCGGVGEFFDIDTNLVRITWFIAALFGGVGFIAYIAAWILVPENPDQEPMPERSSESKRNTALIIGAILIIVGLALLADQLHYRLMFFWPFQRFDAEILIAVAIIGLGLYLVLRKPSEKEAGAPGERGESGEPVAYSRRLTRSVSDRKIGGVCGGIAKYFNIDPAIVRVLFVVFAVAAFFLAIVTYIVMMIVVPEEEGGGI